MTILRSAMTGSGGRRLSKTTGGLPALPAKLPPTSEKGRPYPRRRVSNRVYRFFEKPCLEAGTACCAPYFLGRYDSGSLSSLSIGRIPADSRADTTRPRTSSMVKLSVGKYRSA